MPIVPDLKRHVSAYGVALQNQSSLNQGTHLEELRHNGYTIVDNVLSAQMLNNVRMKMDSVYKQQMKELGGEKLAKSIDDANIIRCPMAYDDIFIELAKNDKIMSILRAALGEKFILVMQNGILNKPNDKQQQIKWHRDLNYQHWTSSKSLAFNFLYCIDDFTEETGATYVLEGSHMHEKFPSDSYIKKNAQAAVAAAGSVIVMDCMVYHRAGENISNKIRRGLNHIVGLPFMAQQIDLPKVFGNRFVDDDFLNQYFGYRWRPAESPLEWRSRRL